MLTYENEGIHKTEKKLTLKDMILFYKWLPGTWNHHTKGSYCPGPMACIEEHLRSLSLQILRNRPECKSHLDRT